MADKCSECFRHRSIRETPDSQWSFVVLFAGFICSSIANGILYSFGVILPELMDFFGESRAKLALVGSLGQNLGYLLGPFGCFIFERFGFRKTVMLCSAVVTTGLALTAVLKMFPLIYLTYGCMTGIGLSFIHNASVVVVMNHFKKWRLMSSGVIQSGFAFGMLGVSQLTRKLIDDFGWRWAFGGWAVLGATTFLCGLVFDGKKTQCLKHVDHRQKEKSNKFLIVVKNKRLIMLSASFALSYMVFYVPHMFLVKYSEKRLGIPRDKSTLLYIYFAVVSLFSRMFFCLVGTYKQINRFVLYQISMALSGIAVLLLKYCTGYVHLALFMSSIGFLDGGFWGLAALLVYDCTGPENMNYGWGLFNSIASLGGVAGPSIAGFIADVNNSYVPAFYFSGVALLLSSCLIFLKRWTKGYHGDIAREAVEHDDKNCDDDELMISERETSV